MEHICKTIAFSVVIAGAVFFLKQEASPLVLLLYVVFCVIASVLAKALIENSRNQ